MLKRLKLTNFRKVTEDEMHFTQGLNVLRGANESSKTTRIEAVLYALYGATLLRTSLDDAVTWGQKSSSLKVELDIELQGKLYTFTRSSSGAEVLTGGQIIVTGQKEVSAFAAQALGADGKAAQRLIFANQNSIRGALEEGPKAVATQIENLCDFDIFDRIVERMQERLLIGSPALLEAKVREAEEKLKAYTEPVKPDCEAMQAGIDEAQGQTTRCKEILVEQEKAVADAFALWQNAENAQRMHVTLTANLCKQEEDLRMNEARLATAQEKARATVDPDEIERLKAQLSSVASHERALEAYREFQRLTYPETFWEGTMASLDNEIERLRGIVSDNEKALQGGRYLIEDAKGRQALARSKRVTSLTCPTCGQEVKDREAIEAQNQQLEAEIVRDAEFIEGWRRESEPLKAKVTELNQEIADLRAVRATSAPFAVFAQTHGEFAAADINFVPPRLTWKGEAPHHELPDKEALHQRLLALEKSQDEARRAAGQAEALQQYILDDLGAVERARQQLAQYPEVANVEDLKREHTYKTNAALGVKAEIQQLEANIYLTRDRMKTAQAAYDQALAVGNELRLALRAAEQDLKTLGFNNALLKKIRAIRPRVADKLWNQVLAAVSAMFSQIRGEPSKVVKDKDGFKANGQSVESLSGSTLDSLGVAIRTALARTFLPHCSFMVMDEPGAGFDANRIVNLIGYLASSGFDQCLLITHDPISESFADNLITL
jgi:DNA repair exonuclease SbcCD ATPase subunit